ncbi:MAG: sulfite exporter TauE/SafE family protein [Bacteroidota bacterium]
MIFWTALSLGFLGSLHCLGMCAPLMLAVPMSTTQRLGLLWQALQYNLGRVLTYSLLGLIFGLLGKGLFLASLQQEFSIFLGISLLGIMLFKINIEYHLLRIPIFERYTQFIKKQLNHLLRHSNSHLLLGAMNGFLPCGLVYLALAGAVTTNQALHGAIFMALFGLGTIPLMLSAFFIGRKLQVRFRTALSKFSNVAMFALAIFMLYRGLSVDVPLNLQFWEALNDPVMCH